jgi:hypothetical protein
MALKQLVGITRKLILAEKRMNKIPTVQKIAAPIVNPNPAIQNPIPAIENPTPITPLIPARQLQFPPLDLGKLNQFVNDVSVKAIVCNNANQNIIIKKETVIETNIQLSNDEILDIIKKFSAAARVPLTPIIRARYANLVIDAFISDTLGSKFILLKQ